MTHILGLGCFHPANVIGNKFLEDMGTGTTAQWIMEKIGIEERLSVLPLDYIKQTKNADPRAAIKVSSHTPVQMGLLAAEQALKRAGIDAGKIGMIICNCCTPRETIPTAGQKIAQALGLRVPAFDIFTACPVFALHTDVIESLPNEMIPDYVLCVSTAALTEKVNYSDRTDGAIWGDGAAAWIISKKHEGRLHVADSSYTSDPSRNQAVVVDTDGYFHQDGRAVRDFSVRQTVRLIRELEERHEINWERDIFIGHQANRTMLSQITNNRGIPDSNHWHNVTRVGNQAGASAPAALAAHWDEIKPGQKIVVAVVGAGLSWGSTLLESTN